MLWLEFELIHYDISAQHFSHNTMGTSPAKFTEEYDMYAEKYVSVKNVSSELKMYLPLRGWVEKTVHRLEIHWLSDKGNVSGQ